jgi:hypothetical protein
MLEEIGEERSGAALVRTDDQKVGQDPRAAGLFILIRKGSDSSDRRMRAELTI